ncbi:hypothetical protein MASR2M48_03040 [Spirochaetota bacterium]
MVDEALLKRYSLPLLLGLASALLYGTVVLMPMFLVPIQFAGARKGFKAMLMAGASSAIITIVWQTVALMRAGLVSSSTLAIGVSAPLAMLLALLAMALPRLASLSFVIRALLAGGLATALSMPSIFVALEDPNVRIMFLEAFEKAGSAIGTVAIDPETLWSALKVGVASSFGAVLFVLLFFSSWFGTRLGTHARGFAPLPGDAPSLPPVLSSYHVPEYMVWVLFAAWGALLLNRFFPSFVLSAVALNAALALSICYGLQGLAVLRALAERVGMAPALRILLPLSLILLLASGVAGLIALGILALLGTLETWIPFRAVTKGDTP